MFPILPDREICNSGQSDHFSEKLLNIFTIPALPAPAIAGLLPAPKPRNRVSLLWPGTLVTDATGIVRKFVDRHTWYIPAWGEYADNVDDDDELYTVVGWQSPTLADDRAAARWRDDTATANVAFWRDRDSSVDVFFNRLYMEAA